MFRMIYLAGRWGGVSLDMKIYLAGEHEVKNGSLADWRGVDILESFVYCEKNSHFNRLINAGKINLLLDSGAFTFMSNKNNQGGVNWSAYIDRYANFILEHKIEKFFELDIDSVVGLKEVERLRGRLESLTQRQCIPVWHRARGLDYWKQMVKEYEYVAIGGIVTREIKQHEHSIFTNLINIAKEHGVKVHGLGYTNLKGLVRYKFDSVDSTSWLYGNRAGQIFKFNGKTIISINKPPGTRLNAREVAVNNFTEWVKFQKYAEKNL